MARRETCHPNRRSGNKLKKRGIPHVEKPAISIRSARADEAVRLQEICAAAFAPVFASFRSILGDEIYETAQQHEDDAQEEMLASLLESDCRAEMYAAESNAEVVGFIAVHLDSDKRIGEIGLNAVHPDSAGLGIGTQMYDFAIARMKEAGMKVATVSTGSDPSHAPARQAYRKAGFSTEITGHWMCRMLD
jgi:ribosomal protein S18 acetylase RimI-like enzyme